MIAFYEDKHGMLPGVGITVRSTVVATREGVVVINPIDFTPQQRADIRAMGNVVAIVEGNSFHSAFAAASKTWFPKAELWGAPGAREKHHKIGWNKTLQQDPWPFAKDLETIFLRGATKISESAFYHPATKTLIVTDLVMNMHTTVGLLSPLMYRLLGINGRFTVATFWAKMIDNADLLREALNEVIRLDFDRLVMSHGNILAKDARSLFVGALRAKKMI